MKPQTYQEKFSNKAFKDMSKDVTKKEVITKVSKAFVNYGIGSANRMNNTRILNTWE